MSTSSALDLFHQANAAYVDEDYETAGSLYDEAIRMESGRGDFFSSRSQNHLKQKNFKLALDDASRAVELLPNSDAARFRKGLALFYLDKFEESLFELEQAKQLGHKSTDVWIRKCKAELAASNTPSSSTKSSSSSSSSSSSPATSTASSSSSSSSSSASTSTTSSEASSAPAAPLCSKVTHAWYQAGSEVTITIYAKNCVRDSVTVTLSHDDLRTLSVQLQMPDHSSYSRSFTLFGKVQSPPRVNITAYKVEIIMKKTADDVSTWDNLELSSSDASSTSSVNVDHQPVKRDNLLSDVKATKYPSSAKHHVDWDEVEHTAKKDEEDEKPTGDAGFQRLLRTIYKDADEETRRAMIKSYQTSGGTVLNCNWKEVKKTDYEKELQKTAPQGSEVRTWKDVQKKGT